jgi:hypothetical protein
MKRKNNRILNRTSEILFERNSRNGSIGSRKKFQNTGIVELPTRSQMIKLIKESAEVDDIELRTRLIYSH